MPAEWEPHRGTWLSWPHKEASWPGKFGAGAGHLRPHGPAARRSRGSPHQRRRPRHGSRRPPAAGRRGRRLGQRLLSPQSHQRRLVPRPRAHLRPPSGWRPDRGGDPGLGLQRLGRQVPAVRSRRRRPHPYRPRVRHPGASPRHGPRGRVDRRERQRHAAHDRGVPPQSQPQSPARPSGDRGQPPRAISASATSSGSATGSSATTPTGTWTT